MAILIEVCSIHAQSCVQFSGSMNRITSLSRFGNEVVGTAYGGGIVFYRNSDVTNYMNTINSNLPTQFIDASTIATDGTLWMTSYLGFIHMVDAEFDIFSDTNTPLPAGILCNTIAGSPNGEVWAGSYTDDGIWIYNDGQWRSLNTSNSILDNNNISTIDCLSDSSIWVSTLTGNLFRFKNNVQEQIGHAGHMIDLLQDVALDSTGNIWIATTDSIYCFSDMDTTVFPNSYPRTITNFYCDHAGVLWGGGNGLQRFNGSNWEIIEDVEDSSFPSHMINNITELQDPNRLILATSQGWIIRENASSHHYWPAGNPMTGNATVEIKNLQDGTIGICTRYEFTAYDPENNTWEWTIPWDEYRFLNSSAAFTWDFNPAGDKLAFYHSDLGILQATSLINPEWNTLDSLNGNLDAITIDDMGRIWVTIGDSLFCYYNNSIQSFDLTTDFDIPIDNSAPALTEVDTSGNLLLANLNAIYSINTTTQECTAIPTNSFIEDGIKIIKVSNNGDIVVGGGHYVQRFHNGIWQQIGGNYIYGIRSLSVYGETIYWNTLVQVSLYKDSILTELDQNNSELHGIVGSTIACDADENAWIGSDNTLYGVIVYNENGVNLVIAEDSPSSIKPRNMLISKAYPNPFNSGVTIQIHSNVGISKPIIFYLYDISGRLVYTFEHDYLLRPNSDNSYSLQIPERIASGIYFIAAKIKNGSPGITTSQALIYLK